VILSADVRRFLRVGVKVTLAMQLAFTERPAPPIGQLWVCAKFAVFPLAMVMPEMIRFDSFVPQEAIAVCDAGHSRE
jgi:hypothetical protein